jgi:hypothetical protein
MDDFDKHFKVKGPKATALRRRKYELARRYRLPEPLIPGSLTESFRRCGKAACRCASGQGHSIWVFSFNLGGERTTETVPKSCVPAALQALLAASGNNTEAVAEVRRVNAQLYRLWRQQERQHKAGRRNKTLSGA